MAKFQADVDVQVRFSTRARNLDKNVATVKLTVPLGASIDLAARLISMKGLRANVEIEPEPMELLDQ